jgi:integrase
MRIGELFGLGWGDVDFNGHFIKVQRACVRGRAGRTKKGKPRRLDMSAQLAVVLKTLSRNCCETSHNRDIVSLRYTRPSYCRDYWRSQETE